MQDSSKVGRKSKLCKVVHVCACGKDTILQNNASYFAKMELLKASFYVRNAHSICLNNVQIWNANTQYLPEQNAGFINVLLTA